MYKCSIGLVILLAFLFVPSQRFSEQQTSSKSSDVLTTVPRPDRADPAARLSPQVANILEYSFCTPQLCGDGAWQQWIIISPDNPWEAEELMALSEILTAVIESLEQQGLDGRGLLSGYRFQRQHGEYIVGRQGRIAVVNHTSQKIILADAAFKRLRGFPIIHELGHVIDQRAERQLSASFHSLVGSDQQARLTAANYWLNLAAKEDWEEATADAFALWVMSTYEADYRPVFAYTPLTTDYAGIIAAMDTSLDNLSLAR